MGILTTHGSRIHLQQVLATTHLKQASLEVVGRIPLIDGLVTAPDPRRKWYWFPRAAAVHIRTWASTCWQRRSRWGAGDLRWTPCVLLESHQEERSFWLANVDDTLDEQQPVATWDCFFGGSTA